MAAYDTPKGNAAFQALAADAKKARAVPTADSLIAGALKHFEDTLAPDQRLRYASSINELRTAQQLAATQRAQLSDCAQALFAFSQLCPIDSGGGKASLIALWWKRSGKPAFDQWQGFPTPTKPT